MEIIYNIVLVVTIFDILAILVVLINKKRNGGI